MTGDVGAVSDERHRHLRCSAATPAGAESDWHYVTRDARVLRGASATQLIAFQSRRIDHDIKCYSSMWDSLTLAPITPT